MRFPHRMWATFYCGRCEADTRHQLSSEQLFLIAQSTPLKTDAVLIECWCMDCGDSFFSLVIDAARYDKSQPAPEET